MRKIASSLLLLLLCFKLAVAQTSNVSGKVVESNGDPVPFATINVKGTKVTVVGGADGVFKIQAKSGDVLAISAVNFDPKEISVGSESNLLISLARSSSNLTDVVVTTALGVQRQAKSLGYSTAKVSSKELNQAKVVNLQNGLTGKVSGLTIQTTNSSVFGDTRITLRGIRSLTGNNQPMLILDGVPIGLNYISSINPNDVADVTVLKSSSATAIYGPDGVNGAIIITTKKGNKSKPQITVSNTFQLENLSYLPKLQEQFGSGSSVDEYGFGEYTPYENQTWGPAFDGSEKQIGRDAPDGSQYLVTYKARPEEKRKFWNTGITNQADVSLATGDFYFSFQNADIKGITPKDENHRRSLHLSANKEYEKFKVGFSLNYTNSEYDIHSTGDRDFQAYWLLINTPMQIPVTRFKDWKNDYWASPDGYFSDYYSNPYWAIDNFRQNGRTDDLFGNFEINYKPVSWFNLTYRLSAAVSNNVFKSTSGSLTYSDFAVNSGKSIAATGNLVATAYDESLLSSRFTSELFGNFSKDVGDFNLSALIGQSYRKIYTKDLFLGSANLGTSQVYNIVFRKGEPTASDNMAHQKLQRFFGRATVGFRNWAFAEFTGSYEMDSRLANPYNYNFDDINYFYPGGSLSIVLSDAIPALKNSKSLSYLKLRGALSKTGNVNIGAYGLQNTFGLATYFPYGSLSGYTANNTLSIINPKPEFVVNREVGIEIGFLKNRLNLEASYYNQDNSNQVISAQYSNATGYSAAIVNGASFTNKGLEFDLKLTPLIRIGDFNLDLKVNYAYQTNKVSEIYQGLDRLGIGNGNYVLKGMPAYTFLLTDYNRDAEGHVIVDRTTGYPTVKSTVDTFGNTMPKHILGINLNLSWKNFTLAAVADYRGGYQICAANLGNALDFAGISERSAQNSRQPFIFPNSVYDDGTGKYVPNNSVYLQSGGYDFWSQAVNTSANSNYIASGSFWKLREVSLSYAVPAKVFGTGKVIKGASITLTGRNLITILSDSNDWVDPEFSNTTGNAQGVVGLDNAPPTRIFGANITLNF